MFTEAQNFAIVQTELDRVFYQTFNQDEEFPSTATANTADLFKPMQTDHAAYIEQIFKGSELYDVTPEVGAVSQTTPKAANKLTTYIQDFTKGVELSKNLFDDNMHGVWSAVVADLALKAKITQTSNAFGLFRNAFTTSLTADGSAICSTHTLIGGGTVVNNGTPTLTANSLNTAIVALMQQKDQAGVIMGNTPSILLVPTALLKKAIEITDSALIADSANNNINVYRSAMGIKVYSSPWLGAAANGSDTAWFLLGNNHKVTRIIRQGIVTNLRDWGMSNNRTYFYQCNFREVVYCPDYAGIWGSDGTVAG